MRFDRASCLERREQLLAATPWWYDPWAHLLGPSLVGAVLLYLAASQLSQVNSAELMIIPLVALFSNALEWRLHKYMLHRRWRPFEEIYRRHMEHHSVYTDEVMPIRDLRELRLILLPLLGVILILLLLAVLAALLYLLTTPNLAALYLITAISYVLSYEWLHLCYHLPPEHPIGGLALIRRLRRHHQGHHSPQLMQRWNFNVTLPLWDWVRGTLYR